MPQPATGYTDQTRRPRYWVKRVLEDPDGGPPRFHIVGYSHCNLHHRLSRGRGAAPATSQMIFVASEMCIDG
jgi:hypothetical protein